MRVLTSAIAGVLWLVLDSACSAATPPPSPPAADAPENAVTKAALPAHEECLSILRGVLDSRSAMDARLARDVVGDVIKLHRDIDEKLRAARDAMDSAFLTGAWREASFKKRAAGVIGEMESVQMLSFISLAFLEGYESPTGQVSPSVRDATGKMFAQLAHLMTELEKLEAQIASTAARDD